MTSQIDLAVGQVMPARGKALPLWVYLPVFFVSGFPALLYQIVWERALFTIYGVNIESVTIIVTVFMLGLGLGSLAGGALSTRSGLRSLRAFGIIELSIGAFGVASLPIFHRVASFTAGASTLGTGLITFLLLMVPTMLMGCTLPLLVAHFVRQTKSVGQSVASLYCVNTLGSAVACFGAAVFIMRSFGESGTVRIAASLNLLVGMTALILQKRAGVAVPFAVQPEQFSLIAEHRTIALPAGMLLTGAVGFISLAYEIVWYRLYSFTSGGAAPCFAKLLAFYLAGIAYGSYAVRDICKRKLEHNLERTLQAASNVVILGSILSFLLGPALSFLVPFIPYDLSFPFVFVSAALLGAAFPILSHATIDPSGEAGSKVSYLYLSNIAGSALGSCVVGFVIMDGWSTRGTSFLLLALGVAVAISLAVLSTPRRFNRFVASGVVAALLLMVFSGPLFSRLYERLLYKNLYQPSMAFSSVVENRSGVIASSSDGTVFGGGVYDGRFNTDLVHDTNGIFRAYAVAGLHPHPKQILVIGLSSGSWAQVVANYPEVEKVTIVEINPGYLRLIRQHSNVASVLRNPKVNVVIDDGRRWLLRNPDRRFDFILMNTSFHWRANITNLLSVEFLNLLRTHLYPGGIAYYNTTWSGEVQATGATVFPYALRVANFLAISDTPFTLDKSLLRARLKDYQIDGRPVFNLTKKEDQDQLEEVLSLPDVLHEGKGMQGVSTESRSSMLNRLKSKRVITDDNMGTEWRADAGLP